jgi:hypothetical protein
MIRSADDLQSIRPPVLHILKSAWRDSLRCLPSARMDIPATRSFKEQVHRRSLQVVHVTKSSALTIARRSSRSGDMDSLLRTGTLIVRRKVNFRISRADFTKAHRLMLSRSCLKVGRKSFLLRYINALPGKRNLKN